jgi:hypothetical protein
MHISDDHWKEVAVVQDALVRKYFSNFTLTWRSEDDAYYQGDIQNETLGGSFTLRLQFIPRHPEICPLLFVWDPIVLPMNREKHPGAAINDLAARHETHTLQNGPGGRVCICHIGTSQWEPSFSYAQVLIKGALWLQAYEGHLSTGKRIADYFVQ